MIDEKTLGCPPVGLLEKSREHVQTVLYFGRNHYDIYAMVFGISRYLGSVDYSRICIQ